MKKFLMLLVAALVLAAPAAASNKGNHNDGDGDRDDNGGGICIVFCNSGGGGGIIAPDTVTLSASPTALKIGGSGAVSLSGNADVSIINPFATVTVSEFAGPSCGGSALQSLTVNPSNSSTLLRRLIAFTAAANLSTSSATSFSFSAVVRGIFNQVLATSNCPSVSVNATGTTPPGTTPPVNPVLSSPNKFAFCYGKDAQSYLWTTPAIFNFLISAPGPGSSASEHWATGFVASVIKGIDATGVMKNGWTPYCGTGTPTGDTFDNNGNKNTAGWLAAIAYWGGGSAKFTSAPFFKGADGKGAIPGWYQAVTNP